LDKILKGSVMLLAWVIDTSDLAFNEVVDKVLKHIHSIKQERG